MTIPTESITVVIQGPIEWTISQRFALPTTLMLTRSLRKLLPGSRIILSTWAGEKVAGLDVDEIIFTKDPGGQGAWPSFTPNNVNRQIISTCAGLNAAKTELCLKIRTDMVLLGTDFLDEYARLSPIGGANALFDYPIVASNMTSRKSASVLKKLPDHPLPFHPCDHVHFGRLTDLLKFWDVPLQTEEDAFYFMDRTQPNRWRAHELSRLAPEQHLMVSAMTKTLPSLEVRDFGDCRGSVLELSDYYMRTHFHFVPDRLFPILFEKYHTDHHFSYEWMRWNSTGREVSVDTPLSKAAKQFAARFRLP